LETHQIIAGNPRPRIRDSSQHWIRLEDLPSSLTTEGGVATVNLPNRISEKGLDKPVCDRCAAIVRPPPAIQ
jgi:hypothetical protein